MRRRGQSWSVDVVLAIVIFGFVAIAVTSFSLLQQPGVERLQQNSQRIAIELEQPIGTCDPVLVGDNLSASSLECLFDTDYETFKEQHNLRGDFCLYVEDESGQVITFRDAGGTTRNGWGSGELLISGVPCGSSV